MEKNDSIIQISRNQAWIGISIFLAVILTCTATICLYFTIETNKIENNLSLRMPNFASSSTGVSCISVYTLRDYEGKIGVFRPEESIPIQILNVYTFTLPQADQEALSHGIRVYSGDALRSLVEDFTG